VGRRMGVGQLFVQHIASSATVVAPAVLALLEPSQTVLVVDGEAHPQESQGAPAWFNPIKYKFNNLKFHYFPSRSVE